MQDILGYQLQAGSAQSCVQSIAQDLGRAERACAWMACLNPHSYAVARTDDAFKGALKNADWLVPDGVGVVIAGRILNRPLQARITGFDIFDGVMRALDKTGGSVFFLGSTEKTLGLIAAKLGQDYPNVRLVGTLSPPFKPSFTAEDTEAMITAVNAVKPDVLWVGMTAPKQEKWIAENRNRLDVGFAGAIGAVFDFYTGQIKRSHPAFQKIGLEWLPRLFQQPRRLWRRMFVSAPIFLWDVARSRLGLLPAEPTDR